MPNYSCLLSDTERRARPLAIIGDRVITRAQVERDEPRKDNTARPTRDNASELEQLQAKVELLEQTNNDLRTIVDDLAATANKALRELDKARAAASKPKPKPKAAQRAATKQPSAAEVARIIKASSAWLARRQSSRSPAIARPNVQPHRLSASSVGTHNPASSVPPVPDKFLERYAPKSAHILASYGLGGTYR